jgi:hypothetical protein
MLCTAQVLVTSLEDFKAFSVYSLVLMEEVYKEVGQLSFQKTHQKLEIQSGPQTLGVLLFPEDRGDEGPWTH